MIFVTDAMFANVSDEASNNAAFFNQQLTHIVARMFEIKHKQIKFRERFRINNEGGAGVNAIQMHVWDLVGSAKIIGDYADDLPSSGAGAAQVTVPVRWVGDSFHYSWMELQRAQRASVPLSDMRMRAANRAIEIKLNNIAYGIDDEAADAGLYGLLNNPNIPNAPVVASTNAGNPTEWKSKQPNEILADINGGFTAIIESTFNAHQPDKLSLPIEQYSLLANTRINDLSDKSILTWLTENSPWLQSTDDIVVQAELKGAGPANADVFFVYQDNDEVAEFYIPYEKNPPVGTLQDGLAYKTPIIASTGGLDIRYPMAYYKGYGI